MATITGTSGWQAMMLGTPVISFWQAYYHLLGEGFFRVEKFSDLSDKWADFKQNFRPVEKDKLIRFIAANYHYSIELSESAYWEANSPEDCYLKYPMVAKIFAEEFWNCGKTDSVNNQTTPMISNSDAPAGS